MGVPQAAPGSDQTHPLPHELPHGGDLRRRIERAFGDPDGPRPDAAAQSLGMVDIVGHERAEHQSFQQRVGRKSVGTVHAGRRGLSDRP